MILKKQRDVAEKAQTDDFNTTEYFCKKNDQLDQRHRDLNKMRAEDKTTNAELNERVNEQQNEIRVLKDKERKNEGENKRIKELAQQYIVKFMYEETSKEKLIKEIKEMKRMIEQ